MSIEPREIVVQEDIQEDYIIYDRVISPNPSQQFNTNLIVTDDNLSNRLWFNMFWTFDDRDLHNKTITVVWLNANNEKGESVCEDIEFINNDERLRFSWNVPGEATYKAGNIKFAVRLTTLNYVWNSLPATVEVKQGLQVNDYEEAQIPSASKLSAQYITKADYDSLEIKNRSILYVVDNDGAYSLYCGSHIVNS